MRLVNLNKDRDVINGCWHESHKLTGRFNTLEDGAGLVREDAHGARRCRRQGECVLGLEPDPRLRIDNLSSVNLDHHCCKKVCLELVCVDIQG